MKDEEEEEEEKAEEEDCISLLTLYGKMKKSFEKRMEKLGHNYAVLV